MAVTDVTKDPAALTMTVTSTFAAPVERVWQLWADPRKLEQWWGPPTWPATFDTHDLTVGSRWAYHMTGPDGDESHAWFHVLEIDPPRRLVVEDGFAHPDGTENTDMPVMVLAVELSATADGGTTMAVEVRFDSTEAMERILTMGMEEGMTLAMGQCDDVLATIAA